jgi:WD40 repeat protein
MLASGSGDKIIKLWNIPEGSLIRDLTGHKDFVIFDYKYS